MNREKIAELMDMSRSGIFKWAGEKRPIIALLDRYFVDDDVDEFLVNGTIERFEETRNQINNYLLNVCHLMGDLFKYEETTKSFAKFCAKYKKNPNSFHFHDFDEETFLFFLARELGEYEEYHVRIFKNAKMAFGKFPSFFKHIKKLIKNDFSPLNKFIENSEDSLYQTNDHRRFSKYEYEFFIQEFHEACAA